MATPSEELEINIEAVDLNSRGVTLPSDRVGMVLSQPYVSLTPTEPYKCTEEAKELQTAALTDTLKVALAARHGATITHFTVFPEYSIPGLEGIALVENALRATDWPSGTIVIGGADALPKPDFAILADAKDTHVETGHNALARIGDHEWINCGVIWVKGADGTVERWLQPKLWPAGPERRTRFRNMYRGKSIFSFNGPFENGARYRF